MIPRLRCVTLNVLGPANPDWERRSLLIKDVLGRLGADVVALQEVRAADVEQLLGPGYQVTPFSSASEDGTGGVLATRARHDVLEEIDQRTPEHGQDLPWCATLIVVLESPVGRVLGDLDATPDAGSMSFWRGRRSLDGASVCFQDAWETARPGEAGFTFSDENPLVRAGEVATAVSRRIDYVLVRAGRHGALLQVLRCDRLLDRPVGGVWASDHYGVVADLAVPQHSPGTWGEVS